MMSRYAKPYREYRTITREMAAARGFDGKYLDGGWDYVQARKIFKLFEPIMQVDFCLPVHNRASTRYTPSEDTAIYVKSGSGLNARVYFSGGIKMPASHVNYLLYAKEHEVKV